MEVCLRSVMILLILLVSMSLYIYNNILDGSMSKISDDSADTIELYESPESSQAAQDITKVLFSKFIDLFIQF